MSVNETHTIRIARNAIIRAIDNILLKSKTNRIDSIFRVVRDTYKALDTEIAKRLYILFPSRRQRIRAMDFLVYKVNQEDLANPRTDPEFKMYHEMDEWYVEKVMANWSNPTDQLL